MQTKNNKILVSRVLWLWWSVTALAFLALVSGSLLNGRSLSIWDWTTWVWLAIAIGLGLWPIWHWPQRRS